jgi:peptide/nickel transport system ATP-binding protein
MMSPTTSEPPLLDVRGLGRNYDVSRPWLARAFTGEGRRIVRAVDGVSFAIPRGTTFAIVGESGCGKSTIARILAGVLPPSSGEIHFAGAKLDDRRALLGRVQMIFQDPYASLDPRWRVSSIVAEPLRTEGRLGRAEIKKRVGEMLSLVGLRPEDGNKLPHQFSGGQRQRISIARALSADPEFLIADEPTSALDVSVQAQILNLMRDLQVRLKLTYLLISHNLAVVAHMADRIGVMYLGRLVEQGPKDAILAAPRHPYTRLLLDTVPDVDADDRPRQALAGEVPSPLSPPSGCAFHPRCPFANERCRNEVPADVTIAGSHVVACHAVAEGRLPVGPEKETRRLETSV